MELLGELIIYGILYWTGKIVLPVLTLGKYWVNPRKNRNDGFNNTPPFIQKPDNKKYVSALSGAGIGLATWMIIISILLPK